MVFDEIDANVGGEVARAVGRKMAALGTRHQVVAITHFPQVAATATHHFVVEKEVSGGRTRSRLFPVSGETRIQELVRMLGGGGDASPRHGRLPAQSRRLNPKPEVTGRNTYINQPVTSELISHHRPRCPAPSLPSPYRPMSRPGISPPRWLCPDAIPALPDCSLAAANGSPCRTSASSRCTRKPTAGPAVPVSMWKPSSFPTTKTSVRFTTFGHHGKVIDCEAEVARFGHVRNSSGHSQRRIFIRTARRFSAEVSSWTILHQPHQPCGHALPDPARHAGHLPGISSSIHSATTCSAAGGNWNGNAPSPLVEPPSANSEFAFHPRFPSDFVPSYRFAT